MNSTMLPMKIDLRPNRSPNLPPRIVAIVWVSRYAVTTQLMCSAPPRSPTMVGSAVATIVESRAASRMPPMISAKATLRAPDPSSSGASASENSLSTVSTCAHTSHSGAGVARLSTPSPPESAPGDRPVH